MKSAILPALDPKTYVPHALHQGERAWAETNCYVDLWIEVLHANGMEPLACMPFTVEIDFEGDQWTFFKFPLSDILTLYGIDVIECNIWHAMLAHVKAQVDLGRPFIVEMDAFYLPDTAGTSYKAEHVKTSIAIQSIDIEEQRLGYFHNAGYFELSGEDFAGIFRQTTPLKDPNILQPYVEVAKLEQKKPLEGAALVDASVALLRSHLARRPKANPFTRYKDRFAKDVDWLKAEGLALFHAYAFATLRQFGACFEVSAAYLRWLEKNGQAGFTDAATHFARISELAKSLQFQLARSVRSKKPIDLAAIDEMAAAWSAAMTSLDARFSA